MMTSDDKVGGWVKKAENMLTADVIYGRSDMYLKKVHSANIYHSNCLSSRVCNVVSENPITQEKNL